jgi:hypothetical protein
VSGHPLKTMPATLLERASPIVGLADLLPPERAGRRKTKSSAVAQGS